MKPLFFIGVAACLCASGCDDSKNPLSDPQTAKPDERLIGVWRGPDGDGDVYYHIGHAGEKFPASVMRIVEIRHDKGNMEPPEEYLAFPTAIKGKTYLNLVHGGDTNMVKRLDEKGWKAVDVDCYTFLKYELDGDTLVMWIIGEQAKQESIEGGKINGVTKPNEISKFTDTTDNLAHFVAEAGDSLWNTEEPCRLERLDLGQKP